MENLRAALRKLEPIVQALNVNPSKKISTKEFNIIIKELDTISLNLNQFNDSLDNADRQFIIWKLHILCYYGRIKSRESFDKDAFIMVVNKLLLHEKKFQQATLNTHKPKLPMSIQGLTISYYSNIKSTGLTIPTNASFVVLTGNNAEGKTSLLQAIAEGIHFHYFDSSFKFNMGTTLIVSVNFGDAIQNRIIWEDGGFIHERIFDSIANRLVAYGASRLQLQSNESQDVQHLKKSNVHNLFQTESPLLNIEHWFKIQRLKQEETRIQAVKTLLMSLMPTIQDIQMGVKKTQLSDYAITYIENGKELLSKQLSAGNKSILAMIGDMLIRLYDAQPEIIEPSQLIGIVLIDELELHLHPSWQKKLPQLLVKHFPLVQFIVSTHSPIVFLGMPPDTVLFNISKDETGETLIQKINIDLANVLPNQILTSSLFGMDDIRNIYNESIQELSVETEPEIKKRKAAEEQLKKVSQNFTFKLPSNDKN